MSYQVRDVNNRIITFKEKTSILLTLAMALSILGALLFFAGAAYVYDTSSMMSIALIVIAILSLVYAFVYNHLRKKADMDVKEAAFMTPYGGTVAVKKKSSIWITLALAFTILGIVFALGASGYAALMFMDYSTEAATMVIGIGIGAVIALAIYAAILNFLRTKLDFEGDNLVLQTIRGAYIELYKKKSIILTIALVLTILLAIMLLALGAFIMAEGGGMEGMIPSIIEEYYGGTIEFGPEASMIAGAVFIGATILLFINAAVLNFLRVRTHVRPASVAPAPTTPPPTAPMAPPPPRR